MRYLPVLTIAGSDCSGGAGIQADMKTMSALGCYAASVVTAVTVQNTVGVSGVDLVRPETVAAQIRAVMDDIRPVAVKIGMAGDAATMCAIAGALKAYEPKAVVVDPVMVSTSGHVLMPPDAIDAFRRYLVPLATLLTPNVPEAEVLSGLTVSDEASCHAAGLVMARDSRCPVLIKGGHFGGHDKVDRLYAADGRLAEAYATEAVCTTNTHGTGCTLSSAIACFIARGLPLADAVRQAKAYVTEALKAGSGVEIGQGHGPVNHFFNPEKMLKV